MWAGHLGGRHKPGSVGKVPTVEWFLAYSQSCATLIAIDLRTLSSLVAPGDTPYPVAGTHTTVLNPNALGPVSVTGLGWDHGCSGG